MLALAVDVRWWKFLHVLGAILFFTSHGVSVGAALRLRKERERARIEELLRFSGSSVLWMYLSLGMLLAGGVVAGFKGRYWSWDNAWLWGSLLILLAVTLEMAIVAKPYYQRIKEAVQLRPSGVPRKSDEELDMLLLSPVAVANAAIGLVALLAILWLMVFKPF